MSLPDKPARPIQVPIRMGVCRAVCIVRPDRKMAGCRDGRKPGWR
jgi:hypothetical protein